MNDAQRLSHWLNSLTYADVRRVEVPANVLLPDGRRLRGLRLLRNLWLGRDRKFYHLHWLDRAGARTRELALEDVVALVSPAFIALRYRAALQRSTSRRIKAYGQGRRPRRSA